MALGEFIKRTLMGERLERDTASAAFDEQVTQFWTGLSLAQGFSSPTLYERVWVANRCVHMNAAAISTMPLRHYGTREPAWVANPDPVWYPGGISDAVYAMVDSMYRFGDAFLLVTARYVDGYPSAFTVLDPAPMNVGISNGRRTYRHGQNPLRAEDVIQITRDPRGGIRGTSAIKAYAAYTNGLLATADMSRVMMETGTPTSVLKPKHKVNEAQAAEIQNMWMAKTASRRGAPAVIPPDIDFEKLGFSAEDLQLLSLQTFDAQVIATAMGVPSALVNMPIAGGLTYSTPILALEEWWRTELRTTAYRISNALGAMALPAGQYVEFDPYKFVAPSWKELVDGWATLVEKGLATVEQFQTVALGVPPGQQPDLADFATPPSAGASPAQQPSEVIQLRPTTAVSSI